MNDSLLCVAAIALALACGPTPIRSPDAGDSGTGGGGGGGASGNGLFDAPHPWTKDVSALPSSAESAAIISQLASSGGWGSGTFQMDDSMHVLEADASAPLVSVAEGASYYRPDCDPLPATMPLPPAGAIEGESGYTCTTGGDCHLLVLARHEKKLYELYQADRASSTAPVTTTCFVVWDLARQYPETLRGEQCTSTDAAGLPVSALLPNADEVFAGEVKHALRFILPNSRMRRAVYVHPATHAGAPSSTNANAPPYGVRFRLKVGFDENRLTAPGARVLARALKKYGMILSDGGNIPITIQNDRFTAHKWAEVGVDNRSISMLQVTDFEVVDLGPLIPLTYDCVRNP